MIEQVYTGSRLAAGFWWIDPPGTEEPHAFYASDLGGQHLAAFPTLDLVAAITAPLDHPRLAHQELVRQSAAVVRS